MISLIAVTLFESLLVMGEWEVEWWMVGRGEGRTVEDFIFVCVSRNAADEYFESGVLWGAFGVMMVFPFGALAFVVHDCVVRASRFSHSRRRFRLNGSHPNRRSCCWSVLSDASLSCHLTGRLTRRCSDSVVKHSFKHATTQNRSGIRQGQSGCHCCR